VHATKESFLELARALSREGGVPTEAHGYFEHHRDRLWSTISRFDLLARPCEHVLDIGPYFAYTPFLWKATIAARVSVFEGDDVPESRALKPLYAAKGIDVTFGNLFRVFDDFSTSAPRLPYPDNSFDFVCCWETMEHFNFNPVPFVRDLRRILKPGGQACITVPNLAKLDRRLRLLFGRDIGTPVAHYQSTSGARYYGFHWREYTLGEITRLFQQNGFNIGLSCHLQTFENRPLKPAQKAKRLLATAATTLMPGFGALCLVKAVK
jgi:SAM-dependent methyltransferase